jgi:hypothetical protein
MKTSIKLVEILNKLDQNGASHLYITKECDDCNRPIYSTVDSDFTLNYQKIPVSINDLIPLNSKQGIEIMEQVLNGNALIRYHEIAGDVKLEAIMGYDLNEEYVFRF